VIPDDNDDGCCHNSSCGQCYNLQHYLLNVPKYFTDHTQLHFLPGLHYLPTNLVIQNVSNISLIGSTVNGRHTTIQCTGPHHIILSNNNKLTVKDLFVNKCGFDVPPDVIVATHHDYSQSVLSTVQLYNCSFILILNLKIISRTKYDILINVNTIGHSEFHNISSAGMIFIYNSEIKENHTSVHLLIDNYQCNLNTHNSDYKIVVNDVGETSYAMHLKIKNINLCNRLDLYIAVDSCSNHVIEINDCVCSGKIIHRSSAFFEMTEYNNSKCTNKGNIIEFKNCHFINIYRHGITLTLIQISSYTGIVKIVDCTFVNSSNVVPFKMILSKYKLAVDAYQNITTTIKNTSFISITSPSSLITISEQVLLLEGPVLFIGSRVATHYSQQRTLIDSSDSIIYFHNYI